MLDCHAGRAPYCAAYFLMKPSTIYYPCNPLLTSKFFRFGTALVAKVVTLAPSIFPACSFLNTCLDSRPSLMLPGRLSSITMTDSLDLSWLNEPSSSIPSTTSTTPMAIEQPPSTVQSEISQPLPAPATTTSTPQSMVYQAFPSQMPLTMNAFDYNMMCLMAAGGFNNVNQTGTAEAIAECNRQKAIMQALMESKDNFNTPHYYSAVQAAAAVAGGAIGGNVVPSMGFPPQPNTAGDQGVIAMRFASQPKPVLTISTASPVKLSMDTSKK